MTPEGLGIQAAFSLKSLKKLSEEKGSAFVLTMYERGSLKPRPKRDLGLVWTPNVNLLPLKTGGAQQGAKFKLDMKPMAGKVSVKVDEFNEMTNKTETLFGQLEDALGVAWGGFFQRGQGKVLPMVL